MENKFIGPKKIKSFVVSKETTPRGSSIVEVTFEDDSTELIPAIMFDKIVTGDRIDYSELRNKRVLPVVVEILDIFGEYDIKLSEVDDIIATIKMSNEDNYTRAQDILWKTNEKKYLDMWRVLKNSGKKMVGEEDE